MASEVYLDNIQKYLLQYHEHLTHNNLLGRFNKAKDAENLFIEILNITFKLNLRNANEEKNNVDGFDLKDEINGVYVQVTSNSNHAKKFRAAVNAFKTAIPKKAKRFIVFFISVHCSKGILALRKEGKLSIEGYDLTKLLKDIYFKVREPALLRRIEQVLSDTISPVEISRSKEGIRAIPTLNPTQTRQTGLYIERAELIDSLDNFIQSGNGLIVGGPGAGKTSVLNEIKTLWDKRKIPCFIIRINELVDGTCEEIQREFCIDTNWLTALKAINPKKSREKRLLIFDAFDTAKDEKLKANILKRVQEAISELPKNWVILVSARTFDAAKSQRLMGLFPTGILQKAVTCRYFEIPDLTYSEVSKAIAKDKPLNTIFVKCTTGLQKLVQVPYFFKLFERVARETGKGEHDKLLHLETEEQLLDVFWRSHVSVESRRDIFVEKLTCNIINGAGLTCRKTEILDNFNADIYNALSSEGIIVDVSVTRQSLSFSHNILLEFAVGQYLLTEDPVEMVGFINRNEKLPFYFRQSFIYFYNRLWKFSRPIFWQHYNTIRKIDSPLFRLYYQTVLNFVLGAQYKSIGELALILEDPDTEVRALTIRRLLEGIRFINKGELQKKNVALFLAVSQIMHTTFLWELGFLLSRAIVSVRQHATKATQQQIAKASLNYLSFVLRERRIAFNRQNIDINGLRWGIENVCKCLAHNSREAKKLINQVLAILQEPDFPIGIFRTLGDQITLLCKADITFAIAVYKKIYYHTENSDKKVGLGNSVVVGMQTTRKDLYQSIYHGLESHFKELVGLYAFEMIPLGIEIVNKFSLVKDRYHQPPIQIEVDGISATVVPENAFFDSESEDGYGPGSHAKHIFDLFTSSIEKQDKLFILNFVRIFVSNARSSYLWKKFIKTLIKYPLPLKNTSFSLLQNEEILISNETVFEAGELIKAVWPFFSTVQKRKIESVILKLEAFPALVDNRELAIYRINRFINCIPYSELQLKRSKKFAAANSKVDNRPLVSHSGLQPYQPNKEESMSNVGFDPTDKQHVRLYENIQLIDKFNSKYEEQKSPKPSAKEYRPLIESVKELYHHGQTSSEKKRLAEIDYQVARFIKVIARNGSKLKGSIRKFVQETATYYLYTIGYKEPQYESGSMKTRWGAISPTPRYNSGIAILLLHRSDQTGRLSTIILSLMADDSQSIRFKMLRELPWFWHTQKELFWDMIQKRLEDEKDGMCFHQLMFGFSHDNILKADQKIVEEICIPLIIQKLDKAGDEVAHELWQQCVLVLFWLIIRYNSTAALNAIKANLAVKGLCRNSILHILDTIDPHNKDISSLHPEKCEIMLQITADIIQYRFDSIKEKGINSIEVKADFEIIDTFIQQTYFTIDNGRPKNRAQTILDRDRAAFYFKVKPLLEKVVEQSSNIQSGFMVAHTGYYFMQLLRKVFPYDSEYILLSASSIVEYAAATGFTYDQSTVNEVLLFAETILADYKDLITTKANFSALISMLDQLAEAGWQEALELTWRLKDAF